MADYLTYTITACDDNTRQHQNFVFLAQNEMEAELVALDFLNKHHLDATIAYIFEGKDEEWTVANLPEYHNRCNAIYRRWKESRTA